MSMRAIAFLPRRLTSVIVGIVTFIGAYFSLFPTACKAVDGVPSWERCISPMGFPAFSLMDWGLDNTFDILIPLTVGVLFGLISWWLLGLRDSDHAE